MKVARVLAASLAVVVFAPASLFADPANLGAPAATSTPPPPTSPPQTPATPDAVAPAPVAPVAATVKLLTGTLVSIELTQAINSKVVKSGDHFPLRLAEPIMADGQVVVAAGVTGGGEVIDAAPAGIGGKPGKLVLAARYLDIGGARVPLRAFKLGGAGAQHTTGEEIGIVTAAALGGMVGAAAVFLVDNDRQALLLAGARATAKLGADITLPISTPSAAPSFATPAQAAAETPRSQGPSQ